jgi:hypothetical protein
MRPLHSPVLPYSGPRRIGSATALARGAAPRARLTLVEYGSTMPLPRGLSGGTCKKACILEVCLVTDVRSQSGRLASPKEE